MSDIMNELFNVGIKSQDYQSENKVLVALVYDEQYKNGLFNKDHEVPLKFRECLKAQGFNLNNLEVFILDNERILGTSIRFDRVFIDRRLPIETQTKVKEIYNKAEVITLR